MSKSHGVGQLSKKLRTFILLWTFLGNGVVAFGGDLLNVYFEKTHLQDLDLQEEHSPIHTSSLGTWVGAGCLASGLLVALLGRRVELRSYLSAVRYTQVLGIGLVLALYKFSVFLSAYQPAVQIVVCSVFFLQGVIGGLAHVVTPVYVMETICDRDMEEPASYLLLVVSQIPLYLSSLLSRLLSSNRLFLTVGVGIFGGIFFLVFVFYIFLPKSTRNGLETEKSEYIEYWHLQFEKESGWLRPGLSVLSLCALRSVSGLAAYKYYDSWALDLAGLYLEPNLYSSGLAFLCLMVALLVWSEQGTGCLLLASTATLAISAFLYGVVLHGLGGGGAVYPFLPISLHTAFVAAHSVGLGPLPEIAAALIVPRDYRVATLGLGLALSCLTSHLYRIAVPALVQACRPSGLFWLQSAINLLGLLYISLTVTGQLSARLHPPCSANHHQQPVIQEFVTQV